MKKIIYLVFAFTCITCYSQKQQTFKLVSIDYADSDSLSSRSKNISNILFNLINEYRKENGLSKLIIDPKGNSASETHNKYMFENNSKIDHNEYNKKNKFYRGKGMSDRYHKAKAEIIAGNYRTVYHPEMDPFSFRSDLEIAKRFLKGWKRSPSHNSIILTPEYKYVSGYANLFIIHSNCEANEIFPNQYEHTRYATYTFYK